MSAGTVAVLRRWRAAQAELGLDMVRPDRQLWPMPTTLGVPAPITMRDAWRRALTAAGVDERRTLHGVRHWHASTLLAAGEAPQRVADRMGHSLPVLLGRYGRHVPRDGVRVERSLPNLLVADS